MAPVRNLFSAPSLDTSGPPSSALATLPAGGGTSLPARPDPPRPLPPIHPAKPLLSPRSGLHDPFNPAPTPGPDLPVLPLSHSPIDDPPFPSPLASPFAQPVDRCSPIDHFDPSDDSLYGDDVLPLSRPSPPYHRLPSLSPTDPNIYGLVGRLKGGSGHPLRPSVRPDAAAGRPASPRSYPFRTSVRPDAVAARPASPRSYRPPPPNESSAARIARLFGIPERSTEVEEAAIEAERLQAVLDASAAPLLGTTLAPDTQFARNSAIAERIVTAAALRASHQSPPSPAAASSHGPTSPAPPRSPLVCPLCPASTFVSESRYVDHVRLRHSSVPDLGPLQLDMPHPLIRCGDCATICKGPTGLAQHRSSRHSASPRATRPNQSTPTSPDPSPARTSTQRSYDSAEDSEAEDTPAGQIACPACQSTYLTEHAYIAHLRTAHAAVEDLAPFQLDIPQRLLFCSFCHLICRGHRGLANHSHRCTLRPTTATPTVRNSENLSPSAIAAAADRDLLPLFSRGVHCPHRTWPAPFGKVITRLLTTSCDLQNIPAARLATTCALILPGLIEEGHRSHHLHVGHMLQDLGDAADSVGSDTEFAVRLLEYAQRIAPAVSAQQERARTRAASGSHCRSVDSLKSSIERLVKERRLGSAMVLVDQLQPLLVDVSGPPNRPALSPSDVSDLIASLHPPASAADDFLPDQLAAVAASTAITVSADDIPDLISNLPPGSAAGASGWTYALLQSLFKATTNPLMTRRLSETFARLVNCILSGKHPSCLLLRVRSVLIPKSSGGYRPLGIGDALYRLACRAALFQLGPGLGSLLAPLQLGIGISGGCEIGGRVGQLIMASPPTSNLIITSTDLKNGFNELGRSRQLAGLMRFAPGLLRWFQ